MFERNKTRFNYPLLIGSFVFVALAGLAILFLHSRQQTASAEKLALKAKQLLSDQDFSDAYVALNTLAKFKPDDQRINIDLALCADQIAENSPSIQNAIRLNMAALAICQGDASLEAEIPVIRRRLVKRMSELGNYEDAIDQITRLVGPHLDLELQRYYTIAKVRLWLDGRGYDFASGNTGQLPNWFASLVQLPPVDLLVKTHIEAPEDFEVAGILVDLCLGDPAKLNGSFLAGDSKESLKTRAQAIVERLVVNRPEDPFSWLLRYEISSRDSKLGLSQDDLEKAVELGAEDPKALLVAASLYLERAKRITGLSNKPQREQYLTRSGEILESVKSITPNETLVYLNIGDILALQGQIEKSIETWKNAKRVCSDRVSRLDFRIVDALIGLKRLPDALEALEEMDRTINQELAFLNRSDQFAFTRQGREYWSRYQLANGDFPAAIASLTTVISTGKEMDPRNQAAIYASLGECYRQIAQHDRSASSFEQASLLAPNVREYRRKAANAWFSAGRYGESYRQFMLVEPKEAIDWIQICEVALELQRSSGQDLNYWFSFDKGVSEIKRQLALDPQALEKTWYLEVLQADSDVMRSTDATRPSVVQNAADQLWNILEKENFSAQSVRAAIRRWKAWNQSDYLKKLKDTLEITGDKTFDDLEKAEILATLGDETKAKKWLESQIASQPENTQLQNALARLELNNAPVDQAIDSIKKLKQDGWFIARKLAWNYLKSPLALSETEQRDPQLRAERLKQRMGELKSLEELLKEFEGPEGTEWRYIKARRLLAEANNQEDINSIELLDLAGFLDRKRPEWPETHLLAGRIAEGQGNKSRAIRAYNYAIQYGNNDLDTYERLVNLLYQQGLLTDARVAIERLGNRALASQSINAVTLEIERENPQDQLAIAQRGTEIRPTDPMAWIWLGQILELQSKNLEPQLRTEQLAKAESMLDKAAQFAKPEDLRVATARFNFYQSSNNQQGQLDVLHQIQQNQKLDPAVQSVALGQIYEALGQIENAIDAYRKAISLGANDLELQNRIAQVLIKENRLEEAIACLTETIERHPQDASTRRRLATLLANRSFDEDWEKVASLLSPNAQSNTPEDLRLQVILLSQKNDLASLQKAQVLLERIVELPGVRTDEDYFQLASLYLRSSRFLEATPGREIEAAQATEAAGRLLKLVASGASPKPENIYTYANYLIGQKRFFDAVEESQKLETIAPDAFPTILLKARITKLEGNAQGALNIIQAWIADKRQLESSSNNPTKLAGFLVQAGQALQILDANEQSQKLLLEAYKLDKRAGTNYVRSILLTDDTATRNNAVRFLMDQLKSEGSSESAILLSLLVRKGDTDEQLMTQAQAQLVSYSVEQQEDRKLLQSLADLWVWRGNESQAIETFRRIVQDRPNDAVALNNLAMLLADAPNGSQEAMQCIDRAIALIGPNPSLLDSKAYVLIRSNKPNEAIAILKTLRTKNDSPSVRFHLYQAYVQSNAVELAKEILSTIDPKTLRKIPLTQVDQQELEKIEKSLSVSPEQPAS